MNRMETQCRSAVQLYSSGQYLEAVEALKPLLREATAVASSVRGSVHNLTAFCFMRLGRRAQAEHHWRCAIEVKEDCADACVNLAILLRQMERLEEAETLCRQALALKPGHAMGHNTLGNILSQINRLVDAEDSFRHALAERPNYPEAHFCLGNALYKAGRLADAAQSYRHALAHRPRYVEANSNLGVVLHALGHAAEAEICFREALDTRPDDADAYHGLGSLFRDRQQLVDAEACFRKVLALCPEHGRARVNLSFLLLRDGRFEEGWRLYESRYDVPGFIFYSTRATLRCEQWQGEALTDKSLLVYQEDGLGDMLQFGRYLSLLRAHGSAYIAVACHASLHRLFARLEAVDIVLDLDAAQKRASGYDFWTSLMSAPFHLRTTRDSIPPAAYLKPAPALIDSWHARLAVLPPGPRIGLVWKGNPSHSNDASRSLPSLSTLASLWSIPGVNFVSLQKGEGECEARSSLSTQPLLHLGSDVMDFADTAAIVMQLDLVICVDTSTAHLAGSLGKPCWVMVPAHGTDWRWMHPRDDSPWYPDTMRVFFQPLAGDWKSTVENVRFACAERFSVSAQSSTRALSS